MIKTTSNKRYKILTHHNKFYLLDMDSNKLTWFLPFLVWFLPIKVFEGVKPSDLDVLKETTKKSKIGGIVFFSSIFSAVLIRVLDEKFWKTVYFNNKPALFLLLLMGIISVLVYRYIFRYKKNEYKTKEQPIKIKLKFTFNKIDYFFKLFLSLLFVYWILYFMCSIFINYGNLLPLVIILPLVYLLSIINTTFLPPEKLSNIEFEEKK